MCQNPTTNTVTAVVSTPATSTFIPTITTTATSSTSLDSHTSAARKLHERHGPPPSDPLGSTLQHLYSTAVGQLPSKTRLDNISWRLMKSRNPPSMPPPSGPDYQIDLDDDLLGTPLDSLFPSPDNTTPDSIWSEAEVSTVI